MNAGGLATKRRFEDKKFREFFSEKMSAITSRKFEDCSYREKHLKACRKANSRASWLERIRKANCGRKPGKNWLTSPEGRAWASNRMKKLWATKAGRRKLNVGEFLSKEAREKISAGAVVALLKNTKPTSPELKLDKILKRLFPGIFKLNVLKGKRIGGKVPDFVDEHDKVLVEMFGVYWHGEKRIGRSRRVEESRRRLLFRDCGYRCVIIWQDELENIGLVAKKILRGLAS